MPKIPSAQSETDFTDTEDDVEIGGKIVRDFLNIISNLVVIIFSSQSERTLKTSSSKTRNKSKRSTRSDHINSPKSNLTTMSLPGSEMVKNYDDMLPGEKQREGVVNSDVIVLSELENENAYPEEISEDQHIEVLQQNRAQCLKDGYMLEKENFDRLHYEDPRVTELKRTEVIFFLSLILHWFSCLFLLLVFNLGYCCVF